MAYTATAQSYFTMGPNLVNTLGGTAGFGEESFFANDDASIAIDLTAVFGPQGLTLFGQQLTSINLSNNGGIFWQSFSGPSLSSQTILSVHGYDVDTRSGPTPTTPGGNSTGANKVWIDYDAANRVITFTWDDTGRYSFNNSNPEAFQLQIIADDEGNATFLMRYENIDFASHFLGMPATIYHWEPSTGTQAFRLFPSVDYINLDTVLGDTGVMGLWSVPADSFDFAVNTSPTAPTDSDPTGDDGAGSATIYEDHSVGDAIGLTASSTDPDAGDSLSYSFGFDVSGNPILDNGQFAIDATTGVVTLSAPLDYETATSHTLRIYATDDDGASSYTDFLVNVTDAIEGTPGDDTLIGTSAADHIYGYDGHDYLRGNAGNDELNGGNGDDYLAGSEGDDTLNGDAGYDRAAYYIGATAGVTVDLTQQGIAQNTGQGWDTLNGIEHVSGTAYGDILTGDGGDNWLWGSTSYDEDGVFTGANNDTIDGGGGHDLLAVGIGNHLLTGGSGTDTVRFTENGAPESSVTISLALQGAAQATGNGSWTLSGIENLSGGLADDTLIGDGNDNILAGDAGNDSLSGGAGNDTLYGDGFINVDTHATGTSGPIVHIIDGGAGGNDTLEGGLGDDTLDGGAGTDTASYANASGGVNVNLGAGFASGADGNDTLANIENAIGSEFNDTLNGGGGDNVLDGLGGNDVIQGQDGHDTIYGGDGDDTLRGDIGETFIGFGGNDVIFGENGNDSLRGGLGDDQLYGGANNDLLRGNGGVDYFDGGSDDGEGVNGIGDRVSFFEVRATQGAVADLRTGVISNDGFGNVETMVGIESLGAGTAYADTFYGNDDRNLLAGDRGDSIYGFGGDDVFQVGSAADVLDGGDGRDRLNLSSFGGWLMPDADADGLAESAGEAISGWTVNLAAGTMDDGQGNSGAVIGIEDVNGGHLGDTLIGDANANVLNGGDGDDTLDGGFGSDVMVGGAGSDTVTYANSFGHVEVQLGSEMAVQYDISGIVLGHDTLVSIENVIGSAFDDFLLGDSNANVLDGLGGNDFMSGNAGDDTLYGGDGDDFLQGDLGENNITVTGNDVLHGGNGNDLLRGGLGDDQFYGGANNDQFRGNGGVDYFDGGADDGEGVNGIGDRVSFFEQRATQGVVADLRTGEIFNDGFGNYELMVGIESLGGDTAYVDTFYGNDGRNFLAGNQGDFLYGFGGDDVFQLISASAVVDGGDGIDRLTVFISTAGLLLPDANADGLAEFAPAATAGWTVNLAAGTLLDGYGYAGTVSGIENVDGTSLADTIIGDANDNVLNGGDGDDTLEGGLGDDTLDGGNGSDTASYLNALGAVEAFLYNGGFGEGFGPDGYDQLLNTENLTGSAFNDILFGNDQANVLDGGDGHDFLQAQGGGDTVLGGNGDDYLGGGTGDDLLDGGAGFDRVSFANGSTGGVTVDLRIQGAAQDTGLGMDTLIGIEAASGTGFSDTLTGDDNSNWLWGGLGPDADTIDGQGGDDLIEAGAADHVLSGGTGTDTFRFVTDGLTGINVSLALQGAAQNTGAGMMTLNGFENLAGSQFADTLTGDSGGNVLAGAGGDDTLSGGAGNDTLYGDGSINIDSHGTGGSGPITTTADIGAGGNDVLEGGLGDDTLDGGGGTDRASYANALGGVEVFLYDGGFGEAFGADGYDQLFNMEDITGSQFDDAVVGNGANNVLDGLGGNDLVDGGGGDDTLYGGDGHDHVRGGAGNDSVYGGVGHDLLRGMDGDDLIDGGDGFDRVSYFAGATNGVTVSLLLQGVAQDTGNGWDTLVNVEGLSGTEFDDHMTGDHQANWFLMTAGNDTILGEGGDDLIEVANGNHVADGGSGTDTVSFAPGFSTGPVTASLALQGAAQDTGIGMMTLSGIENLSGTTFNDTLTGDSGDNLLAGHAGDDVLVGGDGDDTLYGDGAVIADVPLGVGTSGPIATVADLGSAGNDTLEGGLGNDHLDGGGGIDTATYANASGGVNLNLGAGFASGADGNDTLVNIENVIGSEFNDTLNGGGGDNVLEGLGGNDVIQGQSGNDTLHGGDGDDTLRGDAGELSLAVSGNDIMYGGNGNDGLRGGLGDDQMYGGANNDLMRGNGGVDYFDGGSDDGDGFNGIGDRISFFEQRATQGAVADLRTGVISNDGFGNVEAMVGIESLGGDTAFVDTFHGDDNRNLLFGSLGDNVYGHGGDDQIQTASAAAIIDGGAGTDLLQLISSGGWLMADADADGLAESAAAASAGWSINLAAGTTVDGYGNSGSVTGIENVNGSELGDSITGDANANVINGLDGDDTLDGGAGDDMIDGGNGTDTASYASAGGAVEAYLYGGGFGESFGADGDDQLSGIENLTGSAFNDQLFGDSGNNVLDGGGGHDSLRGFDGNDSLLGGGGNDFLNGGIGDDTIDGGAGFDRAAFYTGATAGVTVNLSAVGPQATGQGSDTLVGIESVSGTAFNDVLTGDGGDNWLWGSPAALGGGGVSAANNDTLSGGDGNDLLTVGIGNHSLTGGIGTDTVSFTENGAAEPGLTISLASVGAQATGAGTWTLSGIENLSGGLGIDALTGDNNANVLAGDVGNDTLRGNDGDDSLYGDGRIYIDFQGGGGAGPITTWSDVGQIDPGLAAGNDTLLGGRGNDSLYGGRGDDLMTGNQGDDRFVIEAQSGDDRVTDFSVNIDTIVFDASSGVADFSDLTLTKVGNNTVITWGTSDSLQLDGVRTNQLDADDFEFGAALAAAEAELFASLGHGLAGTSGADGGAIIV